MVVPSAGDIVTPVIDADLVVTEYDPKTGLLKFHLRTDQAIEMCLALTDAIRGPEQVQARLDTPYPAPADSAELENHRRVTQENALAWILNNTNKWWTNVDVVAGILDVPVENARAMMNTRQGRDRHKYRNVVNNVIRQALEALPDPLQATPFERHRAAGKYWCVHPRGQEPPPLPGSLEEVGS
jgi:hypothetical protein